MQLDKILKLTYKEMISIRNCQKLIKDYNYLIGEDYDGGTIEDFIIAPRNEPGFTEAIKYYTKTGNSSLIYPTSSDNGYTVIAILDRRKINLHGPSYYEDILNILHKENIAIDYSDYGIDL